MKRAEYPFALEPLESRIAPASITFNDVDGLSVTVTTSKGSVSDLEAACIRTPSGSGFQLVTVDLASNPIFDGSNLTILKGTEADGQFVDVGFIDAHGIDLGKVKVDGDLGRILAGDVNDAGEAQGDAIKSLKVASFGVQGTTIQPSTESKILGAMGDFTIQGDFANANFMVLGIDPDPDPLTSTRIDARGDIGDITIGGNLIGAAGAHSGAILAKGDIGNVTIHGDVRGGAGDYSGSIISERAMGKVQVDGDVVGGTVNGPAISDFSGRIFSGGVMGSLTLNGSLIGGEGKESGNISSAFGLGNVKILGGIQGGLGEKSGAVGTGGDIGKITVMLDIVGGDGLTSGSILATGDMKAVKLGGNLTGSVGVDSGVIGASGNIASVTVDGSLNGGGEPLEARPAANGEVEEPFRFNGDGSGAIGCLGTLGAVVIKGDINGGFGDHSGRVVSEKSIKSIQVQGSVIGGFGFESGAIGSIEDLGPVKIGADLAGGFGENSGIVSSGRNIASVEIGRDLKGGEEAFGSGAVLTPANIGSVKIGRDLVGGGASDSGTVNAGGRISKVTVGGNILGGSSASGTIQSTQDIGSVTVTGSIIGGFGDFSGSIISGGKIGNVTVGGDLQGGSGPFSGSIETDGDAEGGSGDMGAVVINGSLIGGSGEGSGQIFSSGALASVHIGVNMEGRIEGEGGTGSGSISSELDMGPVFIGGDLKGGSGASESGKISTPGNLTSFTVKGSVLGGSSSYNSTYMTTEALGQVYVGGKLGPVKVTGDVLGGFGIYSATIRAGSIQSVEIGGDLTGLGPTSASIIAEDGSIGDITIGGTVSIETFDSGFLQPLQISAAQNIDSIKVGSLSGSNESRGFITAGNKIGKITVADSVQFFRILAGYNISLQPVNPDASIGTVTVGTTGAGNWTATDVVAGAQTGDFSEGDGQFGTDDDSEIVSEVITPNVLSKIASVVIKGNVISTSLPSDHFGIVANQIGSVKIGGTALALTSDLDVIDIGNSDLTIREVPVPFPSV